MLNIIGYILIQPNQQKLSLRMNTNFQNQHFNLDSFRVKKSSISQILSKRSDRQSTTKQPQSGGKSHQFHKSMSNSWIKQNKNNQPGAQKYQNFNEGYVQSLLQKMQPRDKKTIIPYTHNSEDFDINNNKRQVDQWLGQMTFAVASVSFNMFLTKQLSYQQTKVYFCQNLILNLLLFMQNIKIQHSFHVMQYFNQRLVNSLEYLKKKYPQTKETTPNKKLRQKFTAINNMGNNDNDMLNKIKQKSKQSQKQNSQQRTSTDKSEIRNNIPQVQVVQQQSNEENNEKSDNQIQYSLDENKEQPKQQTQQQENMQYNNKDIFEYTTSYLNRAQNYYSSVQEPQTCKKVDKQYQSMKFENKQNKDYTSQIMTVLNFLIQVTSQSSDSQTNTSYFQSFSEMMQKIFESVFVPDTILPINQLIQLITGSYTKTQSLHEIMSKKLEKNIKLKKNYQQHKQNVKKYTSYKIGQKLDPNTELYSNYQIEQGIFKVKNTAVLRVITKWIEELSSKIKKAKDQILYNPFRFKLNHSKQKQIKLGPNQKYDLYQSAMAKKSKLKIYEQQMIRQCNQIQGILARIQIYETQKNANIPKNQLIVGKFCTRLASAASIYLIHYLNQIIQSLLQMSKDVGQANENIQGKIDLITFKTADLMRCKCSSKENQIIRILSILQNIDEKYPSLLKIVRIKDRLELGTRDILINVNFMSRILCQIQLQIKDQIDQKQKMYDSFNHFLYELSRSELGPIMECACIWTHLDQRAIQIKNYLQSNKSQKQSQAFHYCERKALDSYKLSFVCSKCKIFYSNSIGLVQNKRCKSCSIYFECSVCLLKSMSSQQIKNFLDFNQKLGIFKNKFAYWTSQNKQLPRFAILIPKNNKKKAYIFVQKVILQNTIYFVKIVQNRDHNLQIQVIFKIQNDQKSKKSLSQNFFIFQWTQRRNANKYLQSERQSNMILNLQKRQQQEKQRKIKQDEKAKKQLENIKNEQKEKIRKMMYGEIQQSNLNKDITKNSLQQKGENISHKPSAQKSSSLNKSISQIKSANDSRQQTLNSLQNETSPQPRFHSIKSTNSPSRNFVASTSSPSRTKNFSLQKKQTENKTPDKQIYQIFATVSSVNSIRVCQIFVNNEPKYLALNYIMNQRQIIHKLKQDLNKKLVQQLLFNKKQVLMLQQEMIDNKIFTQIFSNPLMQSCANYVRYIYVDNNRLVSIQFLNKFQSLSVLHANNNLIQSMQGLENLTFLEQVMLSNNHIQNLCNFSSNHLRVLFLGGNLLGFEQQQQQQQHYGMEYQPQEYQDEQYQIRQRQKAILQQLKAQNKYLIFQRIRPLKKLQKLSLFSNNIKYIDFQKPLCQLTNLTYLDLSLNDLQSFGNFNESKKLQYLNLGSNKLQNIPKLNYYPELISLNLSCNQIEKIEKIQSNTKLQVLSLARNKITQIQNLSKNIRLKQLNLSSNKIQSLKNFPRLKQLVDLNLSDNKILQIDQSIELLVSLQKLDLSLNSISIIYKKQCQIYFRKLEKLRYFNIINNPIAHSQSKDNDIQAAFKDRQIKIIASA